MILKEKLEGVRRGNGSFENSSGNSGRRHLGDKKSREVQECRRWEDKRQKIRSAVDIFKKGSGTEIERLKWRKVNANGQKRLWQVGQGLKQI
jgi:hypothetical protein